MDKEFLRTAPKKLALDNVDREKGILHNVEIIRVGEAKGHGHSVDSEFIHSTVVLGNKSKEIKARFGHPNMSDEALGKQVGIFKNFRVDGDRAIADLHLSASSKVSPNGNYYDYILQHAEENPTHFGNSIVFSPGRRYKRDKKGKKTIPSDHAKYEDYQKIKGPEYLEIKELHGSDLVDEPAATKNLFSAQLNQEIIAVQFTKFLDENPEAFPNVKKYFGDVPQLQPFIEKYSTYKSKIEDMSVMDMLAKISNKLDQKVGFKATDPEKPEIEPTPENEDGGEDSEEQNDSALAAENADLKKQLAALQTAKAKDDKAIEGKLSVLMGRVEELQGSPKFSHTKVAGDEQGAATLATEAASSGSVSGLAGNNAFLNQPKEYFSSLTEWDKQAQIAAKTE